MAIRASEHLLAAIDYVLADRDILITNNINV